MASPKDAVTRQQALNIRQSFAVSAPAGSGKTGLLTQRVLALLGTCEQPENILAITFTKKAAAEMQSRILSALHDVQEKIRAHTPPPEEEHARVTWDLATKVLQRDKEKQWQLLSLPNRLRITTIDSFCRQISQQMPLTNSLGHTPEVLDSAEVEFAYQLAARETIALLEKNHPLQDDLITLVQHFNNQLTTLENLFIQLLKRRDQWLGPLYSAKNQRQNLEKILQSVINDHLQQLRKSLKPLSGELISLADYAAAMLNKENKPSDISACAGIIELPPAQYTAINQWLGLVELLTTKTGGIRGTIDKRWGFPTPDKNMNKEEKTFTKEQKQRMLALLKDISTITDSSSLLHSTRELPSPTYTKQQWNLLDSLTRVLTLLCAQLRIIFQQLGKTDFIDITLAALNALGDEDQPTDLALKLDYQIQHILVDEFQDTSTPQLRLLKKLTAGWQFDDGRTLFVVGDAMQSCYGFRDANVGIFLDIRKNGLGNINLTPLNLTVNFRSQKNLVDWCNNTFERIFPTYNSINQGAVKYQHAIAFNSPKGERAVTTHLFVSDEKIKQRSHEANKITEIIQNSQSRSTNESIAILVRKRNQVNEITKALNHAKITYRATEIDKLDTSMVVIDLLTLTRSLLYPNDRIAWLSLLRGPWCGLDMNDLYRVANLQIDNKSSAFFDILKKNKNVLNLSVDGKAVLNRLISTIQLSIQNQGRYNLRQWIESTWLQLGGSALLKNVNDIRIVNAFLHLLEKHQQGWQLAHWNTFTKAVNQLYADAGLNDTNGENSQPAVEIMTIHKAKGLEFDTVIIPGLDQSAANDKQELLVWLELLDEQQNSQLVISPVHATGNERDPIHDYIRGQQKLKQSLESDRLFYVGCTRAINQLHLLAYHTQEWKEEKSNDKDNEFDQLLGSSLDCPKGKTSLSNIWPYVIDNALLYPITETNKTDNQETLKHPNYIFRLPIDWQRPDYDTNDMLKKYRLKHYGENSPNDNRARPGELKQRHARYFGIILHNSLQQITETGYQHWNRERIKLQEPFWQNQLEQMGVPKNLSAEQSHKISLSVQKMLKSQIGSWLLNNQHPSSACELKLWSNSHQQLKELIIDRTFVDAQENTRWIVDYKSSEPGQNQNTDEFVTQEAILYRQQLANYRGLFKNHEGPVRAALYFPLIDAFYEIKF